MLPWWCFKTSSVYLKFSTRPGEGPFKDKFPTKSFKLYKKIQNTRILIHFTMFKDIKNVNLNVVLYIWGFQGQLETPQAFALGQHWASSSLPKALFFFLSAFFFSFVYTKLSSPVDLWLPKEAGTKRYLYNYCWNFYSTMMGPVHWESPRVEYAKYWNLGLNCSEHCLLC